MRKPSVTQLFRVVNILEDGRRLYLSTRGKVLVMPKADADFWVNVARRIHGITIDEMVYSTDLQFYDHRSYFLERLEPFVRVVKTAAERADAAIDPEAFIIGGIFAARVDHEIRPRHDYNNTVLIICRFRWRRIRGLADLLSGLDSCVPTQSWRAHARFEP
jgi:hypothetical protein